MEQKKYPADFLKRAKAEYPNYLELREKWFAVDQKING